MRSFMSLFVIVLGVLAVVRCFQPVEESLGIEWTRFKSQHGKAYTDESEEMTRRVIWESNLAYIRKHNDEASLNMHEFTLEMNKYGDLTNEEYRSLMNGFKSNSNSNANLTGSIESTLDVDQPSVPSSVDWRKKGYVTEVKDQGQCGSCWAFSAVVALEGQNFKKNKKLISLSEQNLIDCSTKFGNNGCNGGLMNQAFEYVKSNKGIDTEEWYPYVGEDGTCEYDASHKGGTDRGYTNVKQGDEMGLTAAVALIGPISVAIDASQSSFQFYSKGIYSDAKCSSVELDHGVAVVGYGSMGKNKDYYIVKNSWGTSWGDQGYILIARNRNNMCGIATSASYPIV